MLSKPKLFILAGLAFIALFGFINFPSGSSSPSEPRPSFTKAKMRIIHIVMFEFKEEVTAEEIAVICDKMLALKDKCLHPTTNTPYVKMAMGGKENSPEGIAGGITHAFVEEFENEEDRKYYLEKDPAHLAFVESVGPMVKKAQVVDFTPGVF
ncbi:hypothetical protein BP5796_11866 [Coleophoma crateriformis]|uniref:Stress-response A/B barrel domain-containing protein n=1 Tax=Coleophoma crateriformis TaxID=565419 RepID=A0A3D8QF38_9HELO|nr:hypothetical protein BP5796_11866 [Coleophoma crateriformis]